MVVATQDRRRATGSFLQRFLEMVAVLLRILLWPLRRISDFLIPAGEYDGLSPAVTEKAAQQFVNHLKSLAPPTTNVASIHGAFSSLGFAALKEEASISNSLIVVYLHSPLHRQADEMCKRLLQPNVLEFLNQPNIKTLGSSIHTSQGASLGSQLGACSFPVLAILQLSSTSSSSNNNNGAAKLVFKAEGPSLLKIQPAHLLPLLNGTYQRHQLVAAEQTARRIEREEETLLRRQQDEEYQETLRADQERERQRQEELEREQRRIEDEEEEERQTIEAEKERLAKAMSLLRPEPTSGGTRIRFVLPSGQKLDRRFGNDETIGALKAFLVLHFAEKENNNSEIRNIALSTSFPKKTHDVDDETLQESDLSPQSVLMVQDLDA